MEISLNKHKEGLGCSPRVRLLAGPGQSTERKARGVGLLRPMERWGWGRALSQKGVCWGPGWLTILEKELVMGRDLEELGLASVPSSSCPRPVLTEAGGKGERQGRGD